MERFLSLFLKGAWVGGSLTIPGVSGGTMAIVLGIYEELLMSVNSLVSRHEHKNGLRFLLVFSAGAILGVLAFSRLVTSLLSQYPMLMRCFFIGAVFGGIPAFYEEIKANWGGKRDVFFLPIGMGTVVLVSMIPQGVFSLHSANLFLQGLGGFLSAVALVLPGISASHLLYVLGIYESLFLALNRFDLLCVLPFLISLTAGIIAISKVAEYLFERYRAPSYLGVLGFLFASVFQMLEGCALDNLSIGCFVTALVGFIAVYLLYRKNKAGT